MTFEENVKKLEEIVNKMEDKSTSLSEGIDLYAEGIAVTKECLDYLNGGKEKIKKLQAEMNDLFSGADNGGERN